jgi:hypothetical protein
MASMWERGARGQYPGTPIAAVRLSDLPGRPAHKWLTSTGSPP